MPFFASVSNIISVRNCVIRKTGMRNTYSESGDTVILKVDEYCDLIIIYI